MELDNKISSFHYRRAHERILFKNEAVLELADGKILWGITRDVSLAGVFLITTNTTHGIEVGNEGLLRVTVLNSHRGFPCRVVQVRDGGIGVALRSKENDFSSTLTEALLQETTIRLGADLEPSDHIQLILLETSSPTPRGIPDVHLVKISGSAMEFLFSSSSDWSPQPGDCLNLEIRKYQQTPIIVEGVVRAVSTAKSGNYRSSDGRICSVILPTLAKDKESIVKELLRDLHTKRLHQLTTQRASYFALHSGPDQPPRSRPEMFKDIERFFRKKTR